MIWVGLVTFVYEGTAFYNKLSNYPDLNLNFVHKLVDSILKVYFK